jgi:hypothetical protein
LTKKEADFRAGEISSAQAHYGSLLVGSFATHYGYDPTNHYKD